GAGKIPEFAGIGSNARPSRFTSFEVGECEQGRGISCRSAATARPREYRCATSGGAAARFPQSAPPPAAEPRDELATGHRMTGLGPRVLLRGNGARANSDLFNNAN